MLTKSGRYLKNITGHVSTIYLSIADMSQLMTYKTH